MNKDRLPLGRTTDYPREYAPEVLAAISRDDARRTAGIHEPLPFRGVDVWTGWELTWLAASGCPQAATIRIEVPASSPNLIESKSLKLYLGSFSMCRPGSPAELVATIGADLALVAGEAVGVTLNPDSRIAEAPGRCIDAADIACDTYRPDAGLLLADRTTAVDEVLHSHLLRSLCPVTQQPDIGSLIVRYSGPKIDSRSLLRYLVSYREHEDFHEACVERIFVDLKSRCECQTLCVSARYQRRGGLDINPYRTDSSQPPDDARLWRQ